MKLTSVSVFCLSLLLFGTHFSLAKRGTGGGFGKGFGSRKTWSNKGNTQSKSNTGQRNNQGSNSQGGYPKQPGQPNRGDYPRQPGGGYHQYPVRGSPYGGGIGGYGSPGSYGGYPGGYINQNPNNRILSPRFGGSLGYLGNGARGGSRFSQSVQQMGMHPNDKSRGFGRTAVMAAAGGAMAGMALGYGLGRFPRPHFHFHSPQEEYYYNHYMYRKCGTRSSPTNDFAREQKYSQPPETYHSYMDSCMKKTDPLPAENPKTNNKPAATTSDTGNVNNTTEANTTAIENSSTFASSSQSLINQPEANPEDDDDDDDDTVSIVEIGYPALIEQIKARRCLELYLNYSNEYFIRQSGGVQGLEMGWRGLLAVFTSTLLMLHSSNMLILLH